MSKVSKAAKRRQQARFMEQVRVMVPIRNTAPLLVQAHLGPTNSGKTYAAMQALVQNGRGVYAAPLRMLAREAYEKLCLQLGEEEVGLKTGEETIHPDAPIICVTTEMAPLRGDMLVLDEAHWAADPTRGWAWSRLLAGGEYNKMIVLGSGDVLPLLKSCFGGQLQLHVHERLGELRWSGGFKLDQLRAGDAVIAYSRRSVISAAQQIARFYDPSRIAILYGAMPLNSRIEELNRIREGRSDLLVSTDVLGHGVNLPLRRVLFTETEKWDGETIRPLQPWEAAQVAGRAGRYGIHQHGETGLLYELSPYEPHGAVVQAGLNPALQTNTNPPLAAFSLISRGRLRPQPDDLGDVPVRWLNKALEVWHQKASQELLSHPWLQPEDIQPICQRLGIIGSQLGLEADHLQRDEIWALATSPVDPDNPEQADLLGRMSLAVLGRGSLDEVLGPSACSMSLEEAEEYAQTASILRWFTGRFPGVGGIQSRRAEMVETEAAARVSRLLRSLLSPSIR